MATKRFSIDEWKAIFKELNVGGGTHGLPATRTDTFVAASWNLRQFGGKISKSAAIRPRDIDAIRFIASVITRFDLVALQEVKSDLESLRKLHSLLPDYHLVVSDTTGNSERLAYLYRVGKVRRTDLAGEADIPMDLVQERMKGQWGAFRKAFDDYGKKREANPKYAGRIALPATIGFERSPHCVSFDVGPLSNPLSFLAFNTHILYGKNRADRTGEFVAFLGWLYDRWTAIHRTFAPNFLIFGDMNTEVAKGDAATSRKEILDFIKAADTKCRKDARRKAETVKQRKEVDTQVTLFPFISGTKWLTPPAAGSNLERNEFFDQIILMVRTLEAGGQGLWELGVLDLPALVAKALGKTPDGQEPTKSRKKYELDRIRQQMSDHLPIWVRIELPDPLAA